MTYEAPGLYYLWSPMTYDRRASEDKPFETTWDLSRYMTDHGRSTGWKEQPKQGTFLEAIKRLGGVWYMVTWDDSPWSKTIYLRPTVQPRGLFDLKETDEAEYDRRRDLITWRGPIKGLTIREIESKIVGLVREYKKQVEPRSKPTHEGVQYVGRFLEGLRFEPTSVRLEGAAALERWRLDVERVLLHEISGSSTLWTTSSLVMNVLENYGVKIDRLSRSVQSRYIRAILDSMARRKLIEKSNNQPGNPMWMSL